MKNNHKSILIFLLIIGSLFYVMKYKLIKNPQIAIVKNTKYTLGKITSKFNYNKRRAGYDFIKSGVLGRMVAARNPVSVR